ncbi:hypothetical protein IFM89_032193 [Coptis chinensis]|uniref:DUF4283 domain-containing protein n=1 Tax=Coptis chinensis TaxID=261450 RepID=A0A835IZ13_9MAGN|nr:hypothetical protein IFM89_032193 [Coptis chinensis]
MITSRLGKPHCWDMASQKRTRLDYVRACVEVPVDSQYPSTLTFDLGYEKIVTVGIEYTWKPNYWSYCKVFGHTTSKCPKQLPRAIPSVAPRDLPSVAPTTTLLAGTTTSLLPRSHVMARQKERPNQAWQQVRTQRVNNISTQVMGTPKVLPNGADVNPMESSLPTVENANGDNVCAETAVCERVEEYRPIVTRLTNEVQGIEIIPFIPPEEYDRDQTVALYDEKQAAFKELEGNLITEIIADTESNQVFIDHIEKIAAPSPPVTRNQKQLQEARTEVGKKGKQVVIMDFFLQLANMQKSFRVLNANGSMSRLPVTLTVLAYHISLATCSYFRPMARAHVIDSKYFAISLHGGLKNACGNCSQCRADLLTLGLAVTNNVLTGFDSEDSDSQFTSTTVQVGKSRTSHIPFVSKEELVRQVICISEDDSFPIGADFQHGVDSVFIEFHLSTMSQGFAIELYFDPALENQVLKAWNVLSLRQITSQLIKIESRPHITLFSIPFLELPKLKEVLKSFASTQEPLSLTFSSIGSFESTGNTLFLSPTPTLSLLRFQMQLWDELKKVNIEIGEEYCPDSWVPQCIVAQDVPKNRVAEAFSVLRDLKLPVNGCGMDIALVEFSPVREVFSFALGNAAE